MSRLFIIGNGFDLAHDLPTSYADFCQFLKNTYPDFVEYSGVPASTLGHHGEEIFDMDEVVGYLMNLLSRTAKEDWSDFEEALGKLEFDEDFDLLPVEIDRDGDRNLWHEAYNNEDLGSQLAGCVPKLAGLFSDWINTIPISHQTAGNPQFAQLIDPSQDLFLSFNYTRTLEQIYGISEVCHIHGVQGGELLFGHGEGPLFDEDHGSHYIGSEDSLEFIHSVFRKDTAGALERHQAFFQRLSSGLSAIYSYGFSFSKVDEIYLKEICRRADTSAVTWYLNSRSPKKLGRYHLTIRQCGFQGKFATFSCK